MPSLSDILSARSRIAPHIQPTPVTFDKKLNIWIKWENQQLTHSFKPRGALNKILQLSREDLDRGVIAASAGNHGQGVGLAAKIAKTKVTVYVPQDAANIKVEKMIAQGAEVIRVAGQFGDAEARAIQESKKQNKVFVSPYNDPMIIAGAGTIGLELTEQCSTADKWVIPVGGGGLIAGMIVAAQKKVKVIGVQSEASKFLYEEFHGRDMNQVIELPSLADGLAGAVEPGAETIATIHGASDMRLVTEEQIADAIRYCYKEHDQVIEGSGAVSVALFLSRQLNGDGSTVVLVTGGNIDEAKFKKIVNSNQ